MRWGDTIATTWIKAIHRQNGKSVSAALSRNAEYILNPDKTKNRSLADSYFCQVQTAQTEFLIAKKMYEQITGRNQGKSDVVAYHIRMSFKPGEVTPNQALVLGRELAMRWTKGKHQFIVAAHDNTKNPHVHIVFNSVNMDCDHKFKDFKRSAIALRRLSDQICLENGLSIIENPGLSKGLNRREYFGEQKAPTIRDTLRELIDKNLTEEKDFDGFLSAMKLAGCEVKFGKHMAIKIPEGKRFIRLDSLGDDYSEMALKERLSGERIVSPKEKANPKVEPTPCAVTKPNLLIDIQAKMQQGYGAGFEHWAKVNNLKEAAKTFIFLQERGLDDYDVLKQKSKEASEKFSNTSSRIKTIESEQKAIAELQKHIGAYIRTKDIYSAYVNSNRSQKFYDSHAADIVVCKSAKKYFNELGYGKDKKLPNMNTLKREYASLDGEKRKILSAYKSTKEEMIALAMAKQNVDKLLGEVRKIGKNKEHDER